jgi:hypothetical protein
MKKAMAMPIANNEIATAKAPLALIAFEGMGRFGAFFLSLFLS